MEKKRIIIIDGYNMIRRIPAWEARFKKSLEEGREALIRHCIKCKSARKDISGLHVVFDGDSSVHSGGSPSILSIHVTYTRKDESADDRIVNIVKNSSEDIEYVVASDDNEVAGKSRQLGAKTMSSSEFYNILKKNKQARQRGPKTDTKTTLSPKEQKEINDSLKREWGIE